MLCSVVTSYYSPSSDILWQNDPFKHRKRKKQVRKAPTPKICKPPCPSVSKDCTAFVSPHRQLSNMKEKQKLRDMNVVVKAHRKTQSAMLQDIRMKKSSLSPFLKDGFFLLLHTWLNNHGKGVDMKALRAQLLLKQKWFEFLDADGSGEIGLDELEDPLVSVGLAKCREDVSNLIRSVDNSDNGEVNFDEFLEMLSEKSAHKVKYRTNLYQNGPKPIHGKDNSSTTLNSGENAVVKLFLDLQEGKFGDLALPISILITAYRRRMLLNAHMAEDSNERRKGSSVLNALESTRREAELDNLIEVEDDGGHSLRIKSKIYKKLGVPEEIVNAIANTKDIQCRMKSQKPVKLPCLLT